ncbi:TVG1123172 [Thermoplasma volcanium GSS1]|uniref:TVG1123172 protein n=1 Tax=Thermoplasma volcanium (strain ATCC 51530 / DSM 4299 / JCM 9571 / NBRC 15438 / GSS1) TaxID=273116 RepID=Q979R7_THEVO|nr:hypothetical protein [Thermoplasma volcanium]BAB60235.1 TVG1123172 [Thermoplasma volcanium GSS1]
MAEEEKSDTKKDQINFDSVPKKKRSVFSFIKKKPKEEVKTVIKVKTVGDVPVIVKARKKITEGDIKSAIIDSYNSVKDDYVKYFGLSVNYKGNRDFIINVLSSLGIKLSEEAYVDGKLIRQRLDSLDLGNSEPRLACFAKLSEFYLDFYEVAKYSDKDIENTEKILEDLMGIYNYMDVAKLYFEKEGSENVNT